MNAHRHTDDFKIKTVSRLAERSRTAIVLHDAELRRLKAELRRVTEERDILKSAASYFARRSGYGTPR